MGNSAASNRRKLDNTLFDIRLTSKSLQRQSKKAESNQRKNEKKVVDALKANDMERAKIYAENAVREKKQSLNLLRMSARLDGVASRIQAAQATQEISPLMARASASMDTVLKQINVGEMTATMDKFETVCEELDVRTSVMEDGMASATATSTPDDQVQALLAQVAEGAGLDLAAAFEASGEVPVGTGAGVAAPASRDPAAALAAIAH